MDSLLVTFYDLLLPFAICACILYILKQIFNKKSSKLPPGPTPFPIIGNILELGRKPHISLAKLSKNYGPLMCLKLGSLTSIVVSSPKIARIVLQKNDQIFSGRKALHAVHALDHHKLSVAWIPAQNQWRKLRKICKEQMFSMQVLDANEGLRRDKLNKLFDYVNMCMVSGKPVDIGKVAFTTSLNLMSATLFSIKMAAFDSSSSQELKDMIWGMGEAIGKPNLADFFPLLQVVDPQRILRKTTFYVKKCFDIFDEIINERVKYYSKGTKNDSISKKDLLETLLELNRKDKPELTIDDIKHLLMDLFIAGTETTSNIVEWAIAELLSHPDKLQKAKIELRNVIGDQQQEIKESDISKLPYLECVIKETFRLHPPAPLSLPRMPEKDVEINGYIVPKNAQILFNLWEIGRDSDTWSNPHSFMPERFSECEIDFRGQHFELIPFGAGRRICPGLPLASRMVHLIVATLIHNFDWKLGDGLKSEELDMTEKFGVTLKKAISLKALPIKPWSS